MRRRPRMIGAALAAWTCAAALALAAGVSAEDVTVGLVERPFGLADVRTIFVARFGGHETGEKYREILSTRLRAVGFEIADDPAGADAVLRGVMVTKSRGEDRIVVLKRAVLQTESGRILWYEKLGWSWRLRRFGPFRDATENQGGPMGLEVSRLARALRSAVEKAVRDAGRGAG